MRKKEARESAEVEKKKKRATTSENKLEPLSLSNRICELEASS